MIVIAIQTLLAALVDKEMPLAGLRWVVAGVVILTALMMLTGAREGAMRAKA